MPRAIRRWKRDLKASYAPLLEKKTDLSGALEESKQYMDQQAKEEKMRAKIEKEQLQHKIQQQEKELWQQKLEAELKMTKKKVKMETAAETTLLNLPE